MRVRIEVIKSEKLNKNKTLNDSTTDQGWFFGQQDGNRMIIRNEPSSARISKFVTSLLRYDSDISSSLHNSSQH